MLVYLPVSCDDDSSPSIVWTARNEVTWVAAQFAGLLSAAGENQSVTADQCRKHNSKLPLQSTASYQSFHSELPFNRKSTHMSQVLNTTWEF
jgi:hypothetical protein